MTKRAVIYCRVSTKEQVEEGNSLLTQERNCRDYASKHNYEIVWVYVEEGESAKTADRTELQKLLRFCSNKKNYIRAVIIYKIDRLSRNTDDYSQIRLLLKQYNVEIKSTSEFFENTPAGRFMENIIANVAQFDNDVRTERSVEGMKGAVREGRYVWPAPVGFCNTRVNGKATIIANEKAHLVRHAFEMMANRTDTIHSIREKLSSMGLVTNSGKAISRSQFYIMLKNELYKGWICKFGEKHKGMFEAIVPETLFDRVQHVMRFKKTPISYKKENEDFPLRRFVTHPSKYKLTGAWSQGRRKKYPYYRFIETHSQWRKLDLEERFCGFMDSFAFDSSEIANLQNEIISKLSLTSQMKEENYEYLAFKRTQIKEKQKLLLQKNLDGIISDPLLKEQLNLLDDEIWSIDKELTHKDERKTNFKEVFSFMDKFLFKPSLVWKDLPFHIKLKIQWFEFPDGVTFDGNEFRTTKTSCLFRLKHLIEDEMSSIVPHPRPVYKHANPSNFPPLHFEDSVVLDEVCKELETLETIINTPAPEGVTDFELAA